MSGLVALFGPFRGVQEQEPVQEGPRDCVLSSGTVSVVRKRHKPCLCVCECTFGACPKHPDSSSRSQSDLTRRLYRQEVAEGIYVEVNRFEEEVDEGTSSLLHNNGQSAASSLGGSLCAV